MIPKIVGILQPGYLPWLGFFEQMNHDDIFVYYDDVQFEKKGWANRNRIKTPNGVLLLTVPVQVKGCYFQEIRETRIDNAVAWQKKHLESIRHSYGKSPYFNEYAPDLFALINRHHEFLLDLDLELLDWFREILGIKTPTVLSSELGVSGKSTERLLAITQHLGGTVCYEGAAGRNYIDPNLFAAASIQLLYQDYKHPVYPQMHGDFVSHLSVVDLLFNCGLESLNIIKKGMV